MPLDVVIASLAVIAVGLLGIVQGVRSQVGKVPVFVLTYRGWSSQLLALPFGGVFVVCLGLAMMRDVLPPWLGPALAIVWMLSGAIFLLGFFVWFPWFLLPGWYRRARKAGVPRHDPYAMARFKRLSRAEQREVAWADLFDGSEGEVCVGVRESLSVPRSPVGGAAVGLVVGLGVGTSIPVEVEGKSLGAHVADAGERFWTGGKDLWKKAFG